MGSERPPFFIVGSARSGTTLLRLMLNAHRDVAVPPESRFITEIQQTNDPVSVEEFLSKLAAHKRFDAWDLPLDAVRNEVEGDRIPYSEAISASYRAYARVHGKSRWGDKTPRYVMHIPFLAELFPNARFIHLYRDGRNVALSFAHVPFGPKNVGQAAALWSERVHKGLEDGRSLPPGRYIEIRYEDIVDDAEGEAKDICDFLDLEFDPGMLDYTERARDSVLSRAAKYNPHVTEKPSRTRSWEDEMPPDQVEVFEAIAGACLSELGYRRSYPAPSASARLKATLGKAGLPVSKLK